MTFFGGDLTMLNFTGKHAMILALSAAFAASAQAGRVPLTFTGWNADLIASVGDASPVAGTNNDFSGFVFYQAGAGGELDGLPAGGSFNSTVDSTPFTFAPYSGNNAVLNSGTITVTTPKAYSDLSFLVLNGETFTVTLTYADSTTTVINGTASGWTTAPNAKTAIANFGTVVRNATWGSEFQGVQMQQFTTSINPTKNVQSVAFVGGREDGSNALFAVSGTLASVATPEPTSLALIGAGLLVLGSLARRKVA